MMKQFDYKFNFLTGQLTTKNQEQQKYLENRSEEIQVYLQNAHLELQNYIKKIRQERADTVSN